MKKIYIIIGFSLLIISLIIFNKIYVNNYNFSLNGKEYLVINVGDEWNDPLYTIDNNKNIDIDNNLDINKEGTYKITYSLRIGIFKKELVRQIKVVNKDKKADLSLNILGDNPYYLMNGNNYQEYGYDSFDKFDGNLTNKVLIENNIDTNKDGIYEIKYKSSNSNGITKTVTRKVIVYSLKYESKLKTEEYTVNNDIILNINDTNYNYTILPNGDNTNEREIIYQVNENKEYIFKIYDNNNAYKEYKVNVKNIDNVLPTGTCNITLYDDNSIIKVDAKDNVGIKGYKYNYGNNKTELNENNEFKINTLDTKVSIDIYDIAGNINNIKCNSIDKSTKTKRSYTKEKFENREYWFYVPKNTSTRNKVPLVIYLHGAGGAKNIDAVNNHALPSHIKAGHDFPYYAVAPHFTKYYFGDTNKFIMDLIDELVKKHNIDPSRIIISGGSNGSDPSYYIAANNPGKFSGMLIIAGHHTISDLSKLTNIKVWFHQGSQDAYKYMENYANELNKLGGNAKITKYNGGHTAPNNAFLTEGVTEWILEKK